MESLKSCKNFQTLNIKLFVASAKKKTNYIKKSKRYTMNYKY